MKKKPSLLVATGIITALAAVSAPLLTLTSCGQNPAPAPTPVEWSQHFVKPTDSEFNKIADADLTVTYILQLKNELESGQTIDIAIAKQQSTVANAKVEIATKTKIEGKKVSFDVTIIPPMNSNELANVSHFALNFTCKNNSQVIWEEKSLDGFSLTAQLPEPTGEHVICTTRNQFVEDKWDSPNIPSRNFHFKFTTQMSNEWKFKVSITAQKQTGGLYKDYDLARVACDKEIKFSSKTEFDLCVYFASNTEEGILTPVYSNIDGLDTQVTFTLTFTCVDKDDKVVWEDNVKSLTLTYKCQPFIGTALGNKPEISINATKEEDRTTDTHFYLLDDMWADSWTGALLDPETGDILNDVADVIEVHNVSSLDEGKYMQLKVLWKEKFINGHQPGDKFNFYFAAQPTMTPGFAPAEEPAFLCDVMCTITFIR